MAIYMYMYQSHGMLMKMLHYVPVLHTDYIMLNSREGYTYVYVSTIRNVNEKICFMYLSTYRLHNKKQPEEAIHMYRVHENSFI
jgi:hypothetical protein